ncbi:MAG: PilZ domain-containing protein [Spirochaetaceae bacterium]|nr:PilZ domain-containing protein [Spirochaetaceae bacterium]
MPVVFIIIAVAAFVSVVVWVVKKRKGKGQKPNVKKGVMPFPQFQREVTAAGFTVQEAALLSDIVLSTTLEDPAAFLDSYQNLDTMIKQAMQKFAAEGKDKLPASHAFLGKLLERRKQVTIQKMNARKILSSSKEIPAGQNVQVVLAGVGIFTTQVVPHNSYFAIFSPIVRELPADFRWEGKKLVLFFRKINEGEYSFSTTVVREIKDEKTGDFVLLMRHEAPLSHLQKRNSVRTMLKRPAHIYPIGDGVGRTFAEGKPCMLSDISDDGCAVTMEGKVDMPRSVIIQLMLGGQLISLNGECRRVQYNRIRNVTLLHIKADPIPRDIKNIILAVVFGIISESNDPVALSGTHGEGGDGPRQTDGPSPGENQPEKEEPNDLPPQDSAPENQPAGPGVIMP